MKEFLTTSRSLLDASDEPFPSSFTEIQPVNENYLACIEGSSDNAINMGFEVIPEESVSQMAIQSHNSIEARVQKPVCRSYRSLQENILGFQMTKLSFLVDNYKQIELAMLKASEVEIYGNQVGFMSDEDQGQDEDMQCIDTTLNQEYYQVDRIHRLDNYYFMDSDSSNPQFKFPESAVSDQNRCAKLQAEEKPSNLASLGSINQIFGNLNLPKISNYSTLISCNEKQVFVNLRNQLVDLRGLIEENLKTKKTVDNGDHYCKLCGLEFINGRQLGGHMSRKHPGRSQNYVIKKQVHKIKKIERRRRNYFRNRVYQINSKDVKIECFQ